MDEIQSQPNLNLNPKKLNLKKTQKYYFYFWNLFECRFYEGSENFC